MALLDLSLVTRALVTLVREFIAASPQWTSPTPPNVFPQPPDALTDNSLGLYLIHVSEDPHYKNQPPAGLGDPPVRFTPMALDLTYQVVAHSTNGEHQGTYAEQMLLGLAMKAMHDYPVLTDATQLLSKGGGLVDVFPTDLKGHANVVRIALLPVTHAEAMSLWAGQSRPPRLAVYYQVSVVMLQPETVQGIASRVLRFGVNTFTAGPPFLDGSLNSLTFTYPGEPARTLEIEPAEAPAGDPTGGLVTFTGANLAGDAVALLLQGLQWSGPVDTGWTVKVSAAGAAATVQEQAGGNTVVPGVYSAQVRVTRRLPLPDGTFRLVNQNSNATPFTVVPRIDSVGAPPGIIDVAGFVFADPDIPGGAVQVHVGDQQLAPAAGPSPNPGEFVIAGAKKIQLQLPSGLPSGPAPLKVVVRGAQSPPRWIVVP